MAVVKNGLRTESLPRMVLRTLGINIRRLLSIRSSSNRNKISNFHSRVVPKEDNHGNTIPCLPSIITAVMDRHYNSHPSTTIPHKISNNSNNNNQVSFGVPI